MLTSLGGVLGVIVGIILAEIISYVTTMPVAISIPAAIGSVLFPWSSVSYSEFSRPIRRQT